MKLVRLIDFRFMDMFSSPLSWDVDSETPVCLLFTTGGANWLSEERIFVENPNSRSACHIMNSKIKEENCTEPCAGE